MVNRLFGEVHRLHLDNVVLQGAVDAEKATFTALRAGNRAFRDDVVRLKVLLSRPLLRPSGMEQTTQPGVSDKGATHPKLLLGVKLDAQADAAERVHKVAVLAASRYKAYEDILVRDLQFSAEVIRHWRESWLLPLSEPALADLPGGVVGGLGPELWLRIQTC